MLRFRSTIAALACLAGAACNSKNPTEPPPNKGVIVVDPDSSRIFIGNTQQFTAVATGVASAKATFVWSTGDPTVATVDQTGLVTGVGKGKTAVVATTNNLATAMMGTAEITVLDPSGGACSGVDTTSEWMGTLTVDMGDTLVNGDETSGVRDKLQVQFTLAPDPANLPGGTKLKFLGKPTGTVDINETVTSPSSVGTNIGSGPPTPLTDLTLYLDTDACTWKVAYSWGTNATVSEGGLDTPEDPEAVAELFTRELPLGVWQGGLHYSAGFPTKGPVGPAPSPSEDLYRIMSIYGTTLFALDPTGTRGPAQVDLEIDP